MVLNSFSPRTAAMAGGLAFVPVAWYGLASSGTAGLVSAINVGIILIAMAIATSRAETDDHHGNPSA